MIRLVIVDDDPLVRMGLGMLFAAVDDMKVVAEAGDGAEAQAVVADERPDVVLMDIRMPRQDGLAATEAILAAEDAPAVIMLTTFEADEQVLRALRAGASGFLLKDTPPAEIVAAVRVVAAGDALLSPRITGRLIARIARGTDVDGADRRHRARDALAELTDRELEVARAVADGRSNAEIAESLHMSVATVKAHISRTLAKLGLDNRVQIALTVHDASQGDAPV